jgi:hypothetical protein
MTTTSLDYVGAIDLLDIGVFGESFGRSFLPYPFTYTEPTRFATAQSAADYARTVPDRFQYGDLASFAGPLRTCEAADIRVECHVQYIPDTTPSLRLVACRQGEVGFVAVQRPDADVVDIYAVSPYELGSVVCDFVSFDRPGRHPSIVVPEFAPRDRAEFDDGDFVLRDEVESPTHVAILSKALSVYSVIQSHWRPARELGPDRSKAAVVWIRVDGDGDYIYEPEYACARPMSDSTLQRRIDQLIADDVAVLREFLRD